MGTLTSGVPAGELPCSKSRLMSQHARSRRSAMHQPSTLDIGMDVHQESMPVAYVAQDHHAAVSSRGASGPRQRDINPRIRTMQSQSNHLVFVYAAGPCGDWLSRSVTHTGHPCWVVAPSRIPKTPGER